MHGDSHPDRFVIVQRKLHEKRWRQFPFHRNRMPDSSIRITNKSFENLNGYRLILRHPHPRIGVPLDNFKPHRERSTLAGSPSIILRILAVAQPDELISRKNGHPTPFKFDHGMKKPVEPFHFPSM